MMARPGVGDRNTGVGREEHIIETVRHPEEYEYVVEVAHPDSDPNLDHGHAAPWAGPVPSHPEQDPSRRRPAEVSPDSSPQQERRVDRDQPLLDAQFRSLVAVLGEQVASIENRITAKLILLDNRVRLLEQSQMRHPT